METMAWSPLTNEIQKGLLQKCNRSFLHPMKNRLCVDKPIVGVGAYDDPNVISVNGLLRGVQGAAPYNDGDTYLVRMVWMSWRKSDSNQTWGTG